MAEAPPPDSLLCNSETNPLDVAVSPPPYFSAIFRSAFAAAQAESYQIIVYTSPPFVLIWNSGEEVPLTTPCDKDARCENISYGGSTLLSGTKYYWRIRFWRTGD